MSLRELITSCGAIAFCLFGSVAASAQEANAAPDGRAAEATIPARQAPHRPALDRPVSLTLADVRLDAALDSIAASAGITIVYTDRVVPVERRVSVRLVDVPVRKALERVLAGTGVAVRESGADQVTLVRLPRRQAASGADTTNVVAGRVVNAADTTVKLVGAVVTVNGTALSAVVNEEGVFAIYDVPAGPQTVTARMIGYRPLAQEVVVRDPGITELYFALDMHPLRLQELVTTATGPQRRLDLANQVTVLRADSVVQTQPIKDLTDLLETRVPGLSTLPTSGVPGDPTRLRLRGPSSILRSNDPIVIVDGVRIYSELSAERSASLAWRFRDSKGNDAAPIPAPSPLDRIDPNSIETVEVLNGPSAATLYGADAANGVIVITTKQGRPGPARWDVSVTRGMSAMPGQFPDAYFALGHSLGSALTDCSLTAPGRFASTRCTVDSVVAYQVLNDPERTVLDEGHETAVSLTVSGGQSNVRYSVTGSYSDEVGLLQLPTIEAEQFRRAFGRAPDDWMERPLRMTKWSVSSRLDLKPAEPLDVALTMGLAGDEQGRSSLEQELAALRGTYVDRTTGLIYRDGLDWPPTPSLVPDFYRRTTNRALGVRTGLNATWRPARRLTIRGDAGVSADFRREESFLPSGLRLNSDSLGFMMSGQGNVTVGTLNLTGTYALPLVWGFDLNAALGFNYSNRSVADLMRMVQDPAGGGSTVDQSEQLQDDLTSYGWFFEPRLVHKRFSLSTGFRFDGGSNSGARGNGLPSLSLPKLGASWLISDEPFFPLKNSRILSLLRLRAAYGAAGVQPGPADRLRLYSRGTHQLDGQTSNVSVITELGNTRLRPERSTEIEGGLDADLFDGMLSFNVTAYRETKEDAILAIAVPASVGAGAGTGVLTNIGVVRNTGLELTVITNLVRSAPVSWSAELHLSRNRNRVVSLADGVDAIPMGNGQRVVAGYPLFGRWERPILGYQDVNGDGVVSPTEVRIGDSVAYVGSAMPEYTAALHTSVGLFDGALTVSGSFDYQDGLSQLNRTPGGTLNRIAADPATPLDQQAVVAATLRSPRSDYGLVQTISTLRFNSLSVGYRLPRAVTRWIGAESGTLAVQGMNLGLVTNYRGKDPMVNAFASGDAMADTGQLPRPREWRVRLNLSY